MVICGNTSPTDGRYSGRIEKVKFGVPASEALSHDIPATLLVLLIKLNKEGVYKKDIWRAPGNEAHVRKLIQLMQSGRLVNVANFSIYTAASVIKKFLCKLPGGVFGVEGERKLFDSLDVEDHEKRRQVIFRIIGSLPLPTQHLLVLLFGTFRLACDAAESYGTRMSPDAVGVSVAPSLFHSVVPDGQRAHIDDVVRFRMASQIISFIIKNFGSNGLFPRENYEYYARITGRKLRDEQDSLYSFQFSYVIPISSINESIISTNTSGNFQDAQSFYKPNSPKSLTLPYTSSNRHRAERYSYSDVVTPDQEPSSTTIDSVEAFGGLNYNSLREMSLNASLDDSNNNSSNNKNANCSVNSLNQVYERQTVRMHTRSEWFLSPSMSPVARNRSDCVSMDADVANTAETASHSSNSSTFCNSTGGIVRRRSSRRHPYSRATAPADELASGKQKQKVDGFTDYCLSLLDSATANWSSASNTNTTSSSNRNSDTAKLISNNRERITLPSGTMDTAQTKSHYASRESLRKATLKLGN